MFATMLILERGGSFLFLSEEKNNARILMGITYTKFNNTRRRKHFTFLKRFPYHLQVVLQT